MRDAVIVAALRTPVGRRGGALADVHPVDLGATRAAVPSRNAPSWTHLSSRTSSGDA